MTNKKMAEGVAAPTAINTEIATSSLVGINDSLSEMHDARARERAARNIRDYLAWKHINSQAFRLAEAHAVERAMAGGAVSGAETVNWIRAHDIVNDEGKPSRPNNDFAPVLVRDICLHNPVVRPHVEMRTGVYDQLEFMLATGGDAR